MIAPVAIRGQRSLLRQIREALAGGGPAQQRLDMVVRIIALSMVAEVCSIYLRRANGEMELFATEGLDVSAVHVTRMKPGEGLVGEIMRLGRPLNLADAPGHPAFSYRPETGEDPYHAFLGAPLPIVLRLLGLLPENGDPLVFWFVLITTMIDVGLIICFQILAASMLADLVEQAELKTGRRSEGLFFAASTFVRKAVQGLGVITAGFVLSAAQFPAGAAQGEVPEEALRNLGLYYAPTILALWMAMMAVMSTYKLSREGHEENLRQLAENRRNGAS